MMNRHFGSNTSLIHSAQTNPCFALWLVKIIIKASPNIFLGLYFYSPRGLRKENVRLFTVLS